MSSLLRPVELKLARAEAQVAALRASVDAWTLNSGLSVECRLREGRLGFILVMGAFRDQPPSDDWGLQVGECAHNLRSALDNLAFALARLLRDPPDKPLKISFPICGDKARFRKADLVQLPPAAADLVERIQPFQRDGSAALGAPSEDLLIKLQTLNNLDKHRVPAVVLLAPERLGNQFTVEFFSEEDAAANVPPQASVWSGPLSPGVTLFELHTNKPIDRVNVDFNLQAVVAIETDGAHLPLVGTLQNLLTYVQLVKTQFDAFFRGGVI